jgi:regulator of sigma E protease
MDSVDLARILQVIFGIGLVIFVHELGHYLAARTCGVRVVTFSLGFGPRLLAMRIGPTTYQIALVPLGGYCRMAGEERRLDGLASEPDELFAQGVGARFFIYSGGVLMNMLFGLVVFPVLFWIGVPFTRPMIGEALPGGAAWQARLPEGAEVVTVDGSRVFEFDHLLARIALADQAGATLLLRDPRTGVESEHSVAPERNEELGLYTIGVLPGPERDEAGRIRLDVEPDSPAWRAGLRPGNRLVQVLNGAPGLPERTQLELLDRAGEPWELLISDGAIERRHLIAPELTTRRSPPRVGVAPRRNSVRALRSSPDLLALGLEVGDELQTVGPRPILLEGDLQRALLELDGPLRVEVLRAGRLIALEGTALAPEAALRLASDIALSEDEQATAIVVQPGSPAEKAGLRSLDEVLEIDGTEVESWSDLRQLVERAGREQRAALFRLRRSGESEHLSLAVAPEERAIATYGLRLEQAQYVYRSESIGAALVFGARYSWRFLEESWLALKRLLLRDMSPKNVGGIISIGAVSYSMTEDGWTKFLFFLCLLSINLAFLNVLPIPVLDGGHLLFLIIEKLKGSPVSERVLGTSQAVGVVLLLSLMVYVTYNDLVRWIFPQP